MFTRILYTPVIVLSFPSRKLVKLDILQIFLFTTVLYTGIVKLVLYKFIVRVMVNLYNCICNQCLSPLTLWVWIPLRRGVLNTTLCDKVCHWLATGRWFSPGPPVSPTNKTNRHDVTEILLKVALNSIILTLYCPRNYLGCLCGTCNTFIVKFKTID